METQHAHDCSEVAKIHLWIDSTDKWCISVGFAHVTHCPWCGQRLAIGPTATATDALETEVKRLQRELVSEHNLMIMYSDRSAATRRKLQEIGAVAPHEEITSLDAIERLGRELHDEQVRRNKWERMCKELGLVALEPAPDALPCGHPREEANDDRA